MIEFNQLKHLVAIAKNKTISKAAEELLISQPGLTKSMIMVYLRLNLRKSYLMVEKK